MAVFLISVNTKNNLIKLDYEKNKKTSAIKSNESKHC